MSRNGSREDVELVDADSNDEQLLVATEISGTVSVAIAARADASEAQLEAAAADALKEVRHRFGLETTTRCSECGSILPDEIEPGTGVYCDQCGTGQLVPDGGPDAVVEDEVHLDHVLETLYQARQVPMLLREDVPVDRRFE